MKVSFFFLIVLVVYFILGIILFLFSLLKKQKAIHYLSLSYVLRAIVLLAPSIYVFGVNIEFSVWITGPIKVFLIPLNYLFVRKLFDEDKGWRKKDIWHFLPFFLDCILTFSIASNHASEVVNGNQLNIKEAFDTVWEGNFYYTLLSIVGRSVSFLQWTFYFVLTIPLIRRCLNYQKKTTSHINYQYLNWLKGITFLFLTMGLYEGLAVFGLYNLPPVFISMVVVLIFYAFYFLLFVLIFSNEFEGRLKLHEIESSVRKERIIDRSWMERFVDNELFLDPNLTLKKTATKVGLPTYKLTQYIKSEGYSSFYSFVNFYRIEKSKQLLKTIPSSYALESVIKESGFNSRSTYFRVFKEFEGETPGCYFNRLNNDM